MENIYIVMPAYNESENILQVVEKWHPVVKEIGNDSRLILFDDGSTDNTCEVLSSIENRFPFLQVIQKTNSGHGPTCLFAYKYSLNLKPNWIFQTDSDNQTCVEDFWIFWSRKNNYDFIIGNRLNRKDGFSRIFVSKALQVIIKWIFGHKIPDVNAPFRLMRSEALQKYIRLIPVDAFLANVYLSILVAKYNEKCLWIPIRFLNRSAGVNSINLLKIIRIGFKGVKDLYKFRQSLL